MRSVDRGPRELWQWLTIRNCRCAVCGAKGGQPCLTIVARIEVGLDKIFLGQEQLCNVLDRCHDVSMFLLERAPIWLDEI